MSRMSCACAFGIMVLGSMQTCSKRAIVMAIWDYLACENGQRASALNSIFGAELEQERKSNCEYRLVLLMRQDHIEFLWLSFAGCGSEKTEGMLAFFKAEMKFRTCANRDRFQHNHLRF